MPLCDEACPAFYSTVFGLCVPSDDLKVLPTLKGRLVVWTETPRKATDNGILIIRPSRFSRSGDLARIRAQHMADALMHLTLGVGSPGFKNNKDH